MADIEKDFVHLVRLALDGRSDDVAALARRALRQLAGRRPDLVDDITMVLSATSAVVRKAPAPTNVAMPVDLDSKLELLRRYDAGDIPVEPTWPADVAIHLRRVLVERRREPELRSAGLTPTRSMLFVGPPGVGKTLAARWISRELELPLLVLDLSAVMSSFLGRTGVNIRSVLDYAKSFPSVLLLDEFDAIAKRRDDSSEIGELKRLVTVLLQEVDHWPAHSLLIAATNHPELLDPAVWRRFEHVVQFPLPSEKEIRQLLENTLHGSYAGLDPMTITAVLRGSSFADIARLLTAAKREEIVSGITPVEALTNLLHDVVRGAGKPAKLALAGELTKLKMSQRDIAALTGLSRDTMRKHIGSTGRGGVSSRKTERRRSGHGS